MNYAPIKINRIILPNDIFTVLQNIDFYKQYKIIKYEGFVTVSFSTKFVLDPVHKPRYNRNLVGSIAI